MEDQKLEQQVEGLETETEEDVLLVSRNGQKVNPKIRFFALFIVIIGLLIAYYAYNSPEDEVAKKKDLNPVIMNCLEKEGKYKEIENEDGTKSEVCTLKDGTEEDAVKFMNNEVTTEVEAGFKINLETVKWRTLKREKEGVEIDHPSTWYYTINHVDAKEMGYQKVIGFGSGEEVWDQAPHYSVEIIIVNEDVDIEGVSYLVELTRSEGVKYVLATMNKDEMKTIVDAMAKTFKLIK